MPLYQGGRGPLRTSSAAATPRPGLGSARLRRWHPQPTAHSAHSPQRQSCRWLCSVQPPWEGFSQQVTDAEANDRALVEHVARFATKDVGRAVRTTAITVGVWLATWAALGYGVTALRSAPLPVQAACIGVLIILRGSAIARAFICMHDCAHGALFPGRTANIGVGMVLGGMVSS